MFYEFEWLNMLTKLACHSSFKLKKKKNRKNNTKCHIEIDKIWER